MDIAKEILASMQEGEPAATEQGPKLQDFGLACRGVAVQVRAALELHDTRLAQELIYNLERVANGNKHDTQMVNIADLEAGVLQNLALGSPLGLHTAKVLISQVREREEAGEELPDKNSTTGAVNAAAAAPALSSNEELQLQTDGRFIHRDDVAVINQFAVANNLALQEAYKLMSVDQGRVVSVQLDSFPKNPGILSAFSRLQSISPVIHNQSALDQLPQNEVFLAKNLHLNLRGNVNDLSPLKGLSNVKTIYMLNTSATDITPLLSQRGLERADLYYNSGLKNFLGMLKRESRATLKALKERGVTVNYIN